MTPDARYVRCEPQILRYEGLWTNNPKDPGGPTMRGITLPALSDFLGRQATVRELRAMSEQLVAAVYRKGYWGAVAGDALPAGIDLFCFDSAVNCGRARAARWLQHALGVAEDGRIGTGTLAALAHAHLGLLVEDMRQAREAHYRGLSTFPTFGHGWLARLEDVFALSTRWLEPAAGRLAA